MLQSKLSLSLSLCLSVALFVCLSVCLSLPPSLPLSLSRSLSLHLQIQARGAPGTCLPLAPISFIFMQILGKIWRKNRLVPPLLGLGLPIWKILNLPLLPHSLDFFISLFLSLSLSLNTHISLLIQVSFLTNCPS